MPEMDPVSKAVLAIAIILIISLCAAWMVTILADWFEVWLSRRVRRRRINRAIDDMNCGAPEGGGDRHGLL